MSYTPQEGVDYIVDLYAIADVNDNASNEDIKSAIRARQREYHPDRLEGLAPEFRAKGERMAKLLGRANSILLDTQKRADYDEVLSTWQGPISSDGTPVITMTRSLQAEFEQKSSDEIIADLTSGDEQVEVLAKSNDGMVSLLEKLVADAGDNVPEELATQYEEALLQQDRNLAIKEANRSDILGLAALEKRQYRAGLEYGDDVILALEERRKDQLEEAHVLAVGGAATRLALLAGETHAPATDVVQHSDIVLPAYFDIIADQVKDIAVNRQSIVEKRLANFRPHYPEAEAQQETKPQVLIGIGKEANFSWFCGQYDADANSVDFAAIPDEITELLNAQQYVSVIDAGYNIITFDVLDQINMHDQLGEALDKYIAKYYPKAQE